MVVVLAHITVVPGREAAFEAAARELCSATLELESGVVRYEYVRLAAPGTYQATLAFDSYESFLDHQASGHHHEIAGAMRESISELRLERVDPIDGCSLLAPSATKTTAGVASRVFEPIDESVLAARRDHYRARYPLDRTAWWDEI